MKIYLRKIAESAVDQKGFTLIEVIVVIVILGALTAIAMRSMSNGLDASRVEETRAELQEISHAISGNPDLYNAGMRSDYGYIGDVGAMPPSLDALVSNPGSYSTWRGPYLKSDFTNFSNDYKTDAWGKLYVYTGGTTIKATGSAPDTIVRELTSAVSNFTANSISVLISDAAGNPPGDSASKVKVILTYPNGSGGTRDSILVPNKSGIVNFNNFVPIGNRSARAVYSSTNDTVQSVISVLPKSIMQASMRFPGALWAASSGGSAPTSIQYVANSATTQSGGTDVYFNIQNPATTGKSINTIKVTYTPTSYFGVVKWNNTTVFNNTNPRSSSGQTVTFNSGQIINGYGATVKISILNFKTAPTGGSNFNMSATQFTVLLSDGSTFTFSTP